MPIFCFYLFSRAGSCLTYREYRRPRNTLAAMPEEDEKLMFGLVFELKQLTNKLNPNMCVGGRGGGLAST